MRDVCLPRLRGRGWTYGPRGLFDKTHGYCPAPWSVVGWVLDRDVGKGRHLVVDGLQTQFVEVADGQLGYAIGLVAF